MQNKIDQQTSQGSFEGKKKKLCNSFEEPLKFKLIFKQLFIDPLNFKIIL